MIWSLVLACLWAVVATVIGLMPNKIHWPAAYVLIATGIPILGYVTYENGPLIGLIVFAAGASVLRWPLFFLFRWGRRKSVKRQEPAE